LPVLTCPQIAGFQPSTEDRTYRTSVGTLAVYFDEADVVIDIQPRAFDLSIFKK
jgi:hypothetical protein